MLEDGVEVVLRILVLVVPNFNLVFKPVSWVLIVINNLKSIKNRFLRNLKKYRSGDTD